MRDGGRHDPRAPGRAALSIISPPSRIPTALLNARARLPYPNAASNHRGRPLGSSRQRPTASIALFAHTLAPFWRRSPTPDHARLDLRRVLGPSSHAAHHQGRIASYDRIIHAVLMQVCIARSAMALDTSIFCSSDRLPLVGLQLVGLHGRWQRTCRAADCSFVPRHLRLAATVSERQPYHFVSA
jgi:hypothetical protein